MHLWNACTRRTEIIWQVWLIKSLKEPSGKEKLGPIEAKILRARYSIWGPKKQCGAPPFSAWQRYTRRFVPLLFLLETQRPWKRPEMTKGEKGRRRGNSWCDALGGTWKSGHIVNGTHWVTLLYRLLHPHRFRGVTTTQVRQPADGRKFYFA